MSRRRSASPPPRPVCRLDGPPGIVDAVPLLLGYHPADSLVVMSLRGPRRRVGLQLRVDLPPTSADSAVAALAPQLAERIAGDGAAGAVLVLYGPAERRGLADATAEALGSRGVDVMESLRVAAGRWWSLTCEQPCCPPTGTAVDTGGTSVLAAARVADGRAPLASRQALVDSLAAPGPVAAVRAEQALRKAAQALPPDRAQAAVQTLALLEAALSRLAAGSGGPTDDEGARLLVGVLDVAVRDEVCRRAAVAAERSALLALLTELVRRALPPTDAVAATLLGYAAYCEGDGTVTAVALDRALASDPQYTLALMLQQALGAAMTPEWVRSWGAGTPQNELLARRRSRAG